MSSLPDTIINCNICAARTQGKALAERLYAAGEEYEACKYVFVECSQCRNVLVGCSEWEIGEQGDAGWGTLTRQWPAPDDNLHVSIPRLVRSSIQEAERCFSSRAYMACAVMCGRAVEALCKDKVNSKSLAEGLKKLKTSKIIDEKLYEWSEALRQERNIGAHANEQITTWQDARDVLDFAVAISEYVYVLDEKYKAYLLRKPKSDA